MSEATPIVRAVGLTKSFPAIHRSATQGRSSELRIFHNLSFEVCAGEMVAVVGESGSGKSSLLHLLAALDRPTEGAIWFGQQESGRAGALEITALDSREAARFRNHDVGYIWQFHYLLPEFTAQENIAMPLLARGVRRHEALAQATAWLANVGLESRQEHRSGELSGGEQQRVAIARALITGPRLLLADEPTGDLDDRNAELIFSLLQRLTRERGLATIVVTHSRTFASRCDRVLRLNAGELCAL